MDKGEEKADYNDMKRSLDATAKRLGVSASKAPRRRSRQTSWGPLYTMVLWPIVEEFDLSTTEYLLADAIEKLAGPHAPVPGWCNASKETLADLTRTARATTFRALKRLRDDLGLIEENPDERRYLRPTEKWFKSVELVRRRLKR